SSSPSRNRTRKVSDLSLNQRHKRNVIAATEVLAVRGGMLMINRLTPAPYIKSSQSIIKDPQNIVGSFSSKGQVHVNCTSHGWLVCERIGAKLEMHGLALCAFAPLHVPWSHARVRRPQAPALPAGLRI